MNCINCGKKIVAGYCICGACGKRLGDGLTQTRIGRFVQHPEELAEALIADAPWCKNLGECLTKFDRDEMIDQEDCKRCILVWLMEIPFA